MIYALQPITGGAVKIGTTENLPARLAQLEAHYRQPLALLATLPGGPEEERAIHAQFAHLRFGRTEQFRPAADLMAFLGRPLLVGANSEAVEAMEPTGSTIINLKGSLLYDEWFEGVHLKTHLSKAVIVRLALRDWAEKNGHDEPPLI